SISLKNLPPNRRSSALLLFIVILICLMFWFGSAVIPAWQKAAARHVEIGTWHCRRAQDLILRRTQRLHRWAAVGAEEESYGNVTAGNSLQRFNLSRALWPVRSPQCTAP